MLFIEINGEKYPCKVHSFTTPFGKDALRVISSEAPLAEDGFRIVDENDYVITDRRDYKYLYREDDECREYVAMPETAIPVGFSYTENLARSPYSLLAEQISAVSSTTSDQIMELNSHVDEIEPYTESKTAYIDDTEVRFNIVKEGNISVFMIDEDGQTVPFTYERVNGEIVVSFEKRDSLATVTISIQ